MHRGVVMGVAAGGVLTIFDMEDDFRWRVVECEGNAARGVSDKAAKGKNDLLALLVDGTIILSATAEYKRVQRLRAIIFGELAATRDASNALNALRRSDIEMKATARQEKATMQRREVESKCWEAENARQKGLHIVSLAADVHGYATYKVSVTKIGQDARAWRINTRAALISATRAPLAILKSNLPRATLPRRKSVIKCKEGAYSDGARVTRASGRRRCQAAILCAALGIPNAAKPSIKETKGANKNKKAMFAYVVWSSNGYDEDRFHSYAEPLRNEVDSSYATKEDTNARINYLFHVQNPWGLDVEELLDSGCNLDIVETE
ncbi:hypothetical protein BC830DRAFT_1220067 [Chytriomyces sp. MP71]|nr:hypothetical protein BC830DRAFT_1220067 [Chytriomyces sp. MP71]